MLRSQLRSNLPRANVSMLRNLGKTRSKRHVPTSGLSKMIHDVQNAKIMMENERKMKDDGSNFLFSELVDNTVSNFINKEASNIYFNESDAVAIYYAVLFALICQYCPKTCGSILKMTERMDIKKGGGRSKTQKNSEKKIKMLGGGKKYPEANGTCISDLEELNNKYEEKRNESNISQTNQKSYSNIRYIKKFNELAVLSKKNDYKNCQDIFNNNAQSIVDSWMLFYQGKMANIKCEERKAYHNAMSKIFKCSLTSWKNIFDLCTKNTFYEKLKTIKRDKTGNRLDSIIDYAEKRRIVEDIIIREYPILETSRNIGFTPYPNVDFYYNKTIDVYSKLNGAFIQLSRLNEESTLGQLKTIIVELEKIEMLELKPPIKNFRAVYSEENKRLGSDRNAIIGTEMLETIKTTISHIKKRTELVMDVIILIYDFLKIEYILFPGLKSIKEHCKVFLDFYNKTIDQEQKYVSAIEQNLNSRIVVNGALTGLTTGVLTLGVELYGVPPSMQGLPTVPEPTKEADKNEHDTILEALKARDLTKMKGPHFNEQFGYIKSDKNHKKHMKDAAALEADHEEIRRRNREVVVPAIRQLPSRQQKAALSKLKNEQVCVAPRYIVVDQRDKTLAGYDAYTVTPTVELNTHNKALDEQHCRELETDITQLDKAEENVKKTIASWTAIGAAGGAGAGAGATSILGYFFKDEIGGKKLAEITQNTENFIADMKNFIEEITESIKSILEKRNHIFKYTSEKILFLNSIYKKDLEGDLDINGNVDNIFNFGNNSNLIVESIEKVAEYTQIWVDEENNKFYTEISLMKTNNEANLKNETARLNAWLEAFDVINKHLIDQHRNFDAHTQSISNIARMQNLKDNVLYFARDKIQSLKQANQRRVAVLMTVAILAGCAAGAGGLAIGSAVLNGAVVSGSLQAATIASAEIALESMKSLSETQCNTLIEDNGRSMFAIFDDNPTEDQVKERFIEFFANASKEANKIDNSTATTAANATGKAVKVSLDYARATSEETKKNPAQNLDEAQKLVEKATKFQEEQAAREKSTQEKAAREKAAREKAAREKSTQEKAAREKAAREKAAQEKAAQEKAAQEKAAQEKAAQEKAAQEKAAQEKAAQEKADASVASSSDSSQGKRIRESGLGEVVIEKTKELEEGEEEEEKSAVQRSQSTQRNQSTAKSKRPSRLGGRRKTRKRTRK